MAPPMMTLRVLIIADDPLARAGLATLLSGQPDCIVVGQVVGETDSWADLDVYQPNIAIWDLGWDPTLTPPAPHRETQTLIGTNLERLANLGETEFPIVALVPDETYAAEVWTAGVRGLLRRNVSPEKLLAALSAVAEGLITIDPTLIKALLPLRDPASNSLVETLTPRELEVLQLLAEGLPNKAIAYRLQISEHTVKFHVNAIMSKLGAQSRTEAVVQATRLGLILL